MFLLRVGQLSVVNEKLKKDTTKIVLLKEAFFVLFRYIFLVFIAVQRYWNPPIIWQWMLWQMLKLLQKSIVSRGVSYINNYLTFDYLTTAFQMFWFDSLNLLVSSRYYISLMDVAQNVIFITSTYIYFKLLIILFLI